MGVNILSLVNKNLKSSGLRSAFEKAGLTEKEISHISNEIGSKTLSSSEFFKGYTVNTELSKDLQNTVDSSLSTGFATTNLLLHSPVSTNAANTIADMKTRGIITDAMGDRLSAYFGKGPSSEYITQNINTLQNSPYLNDDHVAKLMKLAGYDLRQGAKSTVDRGPTPVAEPSKVTPQPSQPVPDKTVTTPEPKPVDPVPETTGEPVAAPKEESSLPKEQQAPAQPAPEKTVQESAKKSPYEEYKKELEETKKQQGLEVTPEYERGLLGSKLRENGAKKLGELSLKRKFDAKGGIADQLKDKFNLSKEDIKNIRRNISDVGTEDNLTDLKKMLSDNSNESLDAMKTLRDNRIFDDISNFDKMQDKLASNVSAAAQEQAAIKTAQTEIPKGVSDDTAKVLKEQRRNSARKQAEAISTGSGRTVSESAGKTEKASDLTNYVAKKGDKYVFDADRLRRSLSNKGVGKKEANDYFVKNIQKDFETTYDEIMNSKGKSVSEKNQALVNAINDYNKRAAGGPGVGDYIFGNQLHTGALGAAALIGVSSQAFGGHKSNAELYSSPF